MMQFIRRFTNLPSADTADQRRSRLLDILLMGVGTITIIALIFLIFAYFYFKPADSALLISGTLAMIVGIGVCLWLNRRGNLILASWIFLTLLTLVFAFVDTPAEVVQGRTMFMFVIPILMASFVLRPYASFIMTVEVGVLHTILAYNAEIPDYTPLGLLAFLVIALVAWLAARNLEVALVNLQEVNQDLDKRVQVRTQELATANDQLKLQALKLANANTLLETQAHDLASANDRLKELDKLKSRFVSDVSHELRTPISNLSIYLEMMEGGNPEKNERYLNVLRDETKRLEKLVTDVLNLSRMEIGSAKVEFTWMQLNDIVERVVLASQVRANAKGLDLQFTPGQNLPRIWADRDQMSQVINNLVGNAINYTPKGRVCVESSLDMENNQVVLKVSDTGFGIAEADIPHLFERFYRGQQAGQSTIPGTGLGLAITREIVTNHKGRIEVESELGIGSTFTIYLSVLETSPDQVVTQGAAA